MSKLVFAAADVRRIVEHSISAPEQGKIADYSKANAKNGFKAEMKTPTEPTVVLVHDQGVYLMSNGTPRDTVKRTSPNGKVELDSSFCAYAEGCNPEKDKDDWYDNARDLVGGDDFGEYLPWAKTIKEMLDQGATHIVVNYGASRLSVVGKYPKGKQPKAERVAWTEEALLKHLQKTMKRKMVAFYPAENRISMFAAPYSAALQQQVEKKTPGVVIFNSASLVDVITCIGKYLKADAEKKNSAKAA